MAQSCPGSPWGGLIPGGVAEEDVDLEEVAGEGVGVPTGVETVGAGVADIVAGAVAFTPAGELSGAPTAISQR